MQKWYVAHTFSKNYIMYKSKMLVGMSVYLILNALNKIENKICISFVKFLAPPIFSIDPNR